MIKRIAWVLGALLLAAAVPLQADSIPIFSTGVDVDGGLGVNASANPQLHADFRRGLGLQRSEGVRGVRARRVPVHELDARDPTSRRIGPRRSLADPFGTQNYDCETAFDLSGLNSTTAFSNGVCLGLAPPNGSDAALTPLTIPGGFPPGVDPLQPVVDINGTADPLTSLLGPISAVPEPGTLLLVGSGLLGVWLRRRSK